jgi:NarL family two-component system response regulator LiaR
MPAARPRVVRVLVADDQRLFAEGVMRLLESNERIEVVGHARNGEEAVRLAKSLRPDLVLMDIGMPGMDGIEATRQIRREVPGAAVLMLTASEQQEDMRRAAEAGAGGYITKDSASSDLVGMVLEISALASASPRDESTGEPMVPREPPP